MKHFFEVSPSKETEAKIQAAAFKALGENRRREFTKKLAAWLAVPAFAAASVLLYFKFKSESEPAESNLELAELDEFKDLKEEDFDVVADLELLEDLDWLETWGDS